VSFDLLLAVLAVNFCLCMFLLGLENILTFALSLLVPKFFIYRGVVFFLRIVDVLATFLGLIVIWADDILRIECHLAVNAKTNRAVLIDKSFNKLE
jgi:hypothetical protein